MGGMENFGFWAIVGGVAALVALSLAFGFLRGNREGLRTAESDILVYKDQLREIDRDVARGILPEAEAEAARLEVKRRLLAADRKSQLAQTKAVGPVWVPGAVLIGAVMAASFGLYATIGSPGYSDLPLAERLALSEAARSNRPSQAQAEAGYQAPDLEAANPEHLALMEQLRRVLVDRPDDLAGFNLLAENEARLGRFPEARAAKVRVLELLGPDAGAEDWADLAELSVMAAGGYFSPETEVAVERALGLDPGNGVARYLKGLGELQLGRADITHQMWISLLADSAPGDPWVRPIMGDIERVRILAGVPERDQQNLDFGGRDAEIRAMVEGLASRLANEGGPAEDWARLVHSLAVLGEDDRAQAIVDEAKTVFASDEAALTIIERAARGSGEKP